MLDTHVQIEIQQGQGQGQGEGEGQEQGKGQGPDRHTALSLGPPPKTRITSSLRPEGGPNNRQETI